MAKTNFPKVKRVLSRRQSRAREDYDEALTGIAHLTFQMIQEETPEGYSPEFYRGLLTGINHLANDLAMLLHGSTPVFLRGLLWARLEERLDVNGCYAHFVRDAAADND